MRIFIISVLITSTIMPLTHEQKSNIGNKIWHNECSKSVEKLTFWNENEPFPSFGIGHFIWYPKKYDGPYSETFPDLIRFLLNKKVRLPKWLRSAKSCPWSTRQEFMANFNSTRMIELRTLLQSTIAEQTDFIINRMERSIEFINKKISRHEPEKRKKIRSIVNKMRQSEHGTFALIDYINFKGDGTNPNEQYAGHQWGLQHVLLAMNEHAENIVKNFIETAYALLEKRVEHAPKDKPEKQFLPGWKNRLMRYLPS